MEIDEPLLFPVLLTLKTSAACILLYLCPGLPLALWLSRSRTSLSRFVSFLVTMPIVFPPIAMGFILLQLLGKNGVIGAPLYSIFGVRLVFSQTAVVLAAFIAGLPLVVRPLQAAMGRIEIIRLEEAARTLGCTRWKIFLLVTIPQVGGIIISSLLLGIARASGEVGMTMMLAGNIAGKTNTLSLEIYNCVSRGEFDDAMKLCVILAAMALLFYLLLEKFSVKEE